MSATSLFNLPSSQELVVLRVRLSDGTVVERVPGEVIQLPDALLYSLEDVHVERGTK